MSRRSGWRARCRPSALSPWYPRPGGRRLSSDRGPGERAARSGRWEGPGGQHGAHPPAEHLHLGRVQQRGQHIAEGTVEGGLKRSEPLPVRVGDRLAGEVPQHRAELGINVEADAVVDGPDLAVGVGEDVARLAVSVVDHEIEEGDATEVAAMALVEVEGRALEVVLDEGLDGADAE